MVFVSPYGRISIVDEAELTASSQEPEVEVEVAMGTTRNRRYFDVLNVPLDK